MDATTQWKERLEAGLNAETISPRYATSGLQPCAGGVPTGCGKNGRRGCCAALYGPANR